MDINNFPKCTVIIRGYTEEQILAVVDVLKDFSEYFAVEITLNTKNALSIINKLNNLYGNKILIGAGTVRTVQDAKSAIKNNAQFLLGPHGFSEEIHKICNDNNVISIPSAMTPTEINTQLLLGAKIIKIFPASALGAKFFKDVQAPLGDLPLMAVGGISANNAKEFFNNKTSYLGVGSNMFSKNSIETLDKKSIEKDIVEFINVLNTF